MNRPISLEHGESASIEQLDIFFDGETYDPVLDKDRFSKQLSLVRAIMNDGQWHTLSELSSRTEAKEQSVSARLRDMRKERFGAHQIERQRLAHGIFQYRLVN